jgi:hypothetical protein
MTVLFLEDLQGLEHSYYETNNIDLEVDEIDFINKQTQQHDLGMITMNIMTYTLQQSPGIWGK